MELNETINYTLFLLILMRMSGFILLNPILGRKTIPMIVKSGFILVLSLVIFAFADEWKLNIEIRGSLELGVMLIKEFLVGFLLGYIMQLFEYVITFAGEIMDFQMGLSMASIYDPQSNSQMSLSGRIFTVFYSLLFFAVDGHLALIKILITSHEIVGFGDITLGSACVKAVLYIFITCVVMAVKFAFPLLAIEFLAEIGVGILMKVIPQINVFMVNIQAKILVGFMMLAFLFSPMTEYLERIITTMMKTLLEVLKLV